MIDETALFKVQYGMYIITTKYEQIQNGQIATTLMQVTNDPIQFSICLSKNTYTHELITKSNLFAASVLAQDTPMPFIGRFGYKCGREYAKCDEINYETNITGAPLITDHALVVLEAKVVQSLDVKTHTIFVGEVLSAKQIATGPAMTYEYYHTVVKGKSPENAPTFIKK